MSKYWPTSSRSTAGANGRNDSRYLTLRFSVFCIDGERARPEFHAALHPADRLLLGESLGGVEDRLLVGQPHEPAAGLGQALGDLVVGVLGAEIGAGHAVHVAVELARLAEIAVISGVGRA